MVPEDPQEPTPEEEEMEETTYEMSPAERRFGPMFLLWAVAILCLMALLGSNWTNGTAFTAILIGWLVITSPLMVATARWLAALDEVR